MEMFLKGKIISFGPPYVSLLFKPQLCACGRLIEPHQVLKARPKISAICDTISPPFHIMINNIECSNICFTAHICSLLNPDNIT